MKGVLRIVKPVIKGVGIKVLTPIFGFDIDHQLEVIGKTIYDGRLAFPWSLDGLWTKNGSLRVLVDAMVNLASYDSLSSVFAIVVKDIDNKDLI
jgi:hypothetical protein